MVHTRSKSTNEESSDAMKTAVTGANQALERGTPEGDKTLRPGRSAQSRGSKASRKRLLAELEAKEKLAALEVKAVQAEKELALARLRILQAEETEDDEELGAEDEAEDRSARVQEWLARHQEKQDEQIYTQKELASIMDDPQLKKGHGRPALIGGPRPLIDLRQVEIQTSGVPAESNGNGKKALPCSTPAAPQSDVAVLATALQQAIRVSAGETPKFLQELPSFDGHSDTWLPFKAAYEETENMFSAIENVARIRKSLGGAAKEAASCLLIGSTNPRVVMEALERRFGRAEVLVMREIEKTRALPRISDDPRDICVFANKIANVVATIEALKKLPYLCNPELVRTILEKISPILKNKWYDYASKQEKDNLPDLKKIADFLNEETDKCGPYAPAETIRPEEPRERAREIKRSYLSDNENKETCPECDGEHRLPACHRFETADSDGRWEMARKHHLCFRCLRGPHRSFNCRAKPCGAGGVCELPHHRMLHIERQCEKKEEVASAVEQTNAVNLQRRWAYLKIVPVILTGPRGSIEVHAILDEGSTVTLVEENIIEALGIDGPIDVMCVRGVNGSERKHMNSKTVDVRVRGRHASEERTLRSARTVKRLNFSTQAIEDKDVQDCPHLNDLRKKLLYEPAAPKLLIGQDNWDLVVSSEVRVGQQDKPVASLTLLGWVLHGCRSLRNETTLFCGYVTLTEDEEKTSKKENPKVPGKRDRCYVPYRREQERKSTKGRGNVGAESVCHGATTKMPASPSAGAPASPGARHMPVRDARQTENPAHIPQQSEIPPPEPPRAISMSALTSQRQGSRTQAAQARTGANAVRAPLPAPPDYLPSPVSTPAGAWRLEYGAPRAKRKRRRHRRRQRAASSPLACSPCKGHPATIEKFRRDYHV